MMCMMMHLMGHSDQEGEHSHLQRHELSATDILKRRYALGEITREQFQEMVQIIREADAKPAHHHLETN